MTPQAAGALAGLAAGVVTSAAMITGRDAGVLTRTLDRDAVDWIDRTTGSRAVIGDRGTSLVEYANHLGASAAFGYGFARLRQAWSGGPDWVAGLGYGTALYAVNIAGIAPLLGITQGERAAGPRKAGERLGLHLLQAGLTALLWNRLRRRTVAA